MSLANVAVAVAQVFLGGSLVQLVLALTRRRSELRQLDRQSDSIVVEGAEHVVQMLRAEVARGEEKIARLEIEKNDLVRQVRLLGERVSRQGAELAVARAEIAHLKDR